MTDIDEAPSAQLPLWNDKTMRGIPEIAHLCAVDAGTVRQWIMRKRHGDSVPTTVPECTGYARRTLGNRQRVVPFWTAAQALTIATEYAGTKLNSTNAQYKQTSQPKQSERPESGTENSHEQ